MSHLQGIVPVHRSSHRRLIHQSLVVAALIVSIGAIAARTRANETDQFTLPPNARFADLGRFFNLMHYQVLEDVVESVNEEIDEASAIRNESVRAARLDRLHAAGMLADMVRHRFGPGFFETIGAEVALRDKRIERCHPDELIIYRNRDWIYNGAHLPIDPRNLPLLIPSSTICVYGVYFGTDKLGHFHDLGHIYFKSFLGKVERGLSEDEAMKRVIAEFSEGIISEASIIGAIGTGVFSNADLASNYVGMKFYRNLTEPVTLEGREYPPLLVRHGEHWRLNRHVRPESAFFRPFICDHFNEALNPCVYEWGLRGDVRRRLEECADDILAFYADENDQPHGREWFDEKARELTTYYGEDYGHSGIEEPTMVTIASACFPDSIADVENVEYADRPAHNEPVSAGVRDGDN